ncbi:MAG: Peptidase [Ignavibacteria bacterium]|nr:Peptidase [Ignavibacteria bacterium]
MNNDNINLDKYFEQARSEQAIISKDEARNLVVSASGKYVQHLADVGHLTHSYKPKLIKGIKPMNIVYAAITTAAAAGFIAYNTLLPPEKFTPNTASKTTTAVKDVQHPVVPKDVQHPADVGHLESLKDVQHLGDVGHLKTDNDESTNERQSPCPTPSKVDIKGVQIIELSPKELENLGIKVNFDETEGGKLTYWVAGKDKAHPFTVFVKGGVSLDPWANYNVTEQVKVSFSPRLITDNAGNRRIESLPDEEETNNSIIQANYADETTTKSSVFDAKNNIKLEKYESKPRTPNDNTTYVNSTFFTDGEKVKGKVIKVLADDSNSQKVLKVNHSDNDNTSVVTSTIYSTVNDINENDSTKYIAKINVSKNENSQNKDKQVETYSFHQTAPVIIVEQNNDIGNTDGSNNNTVIVNGINNSNSNASSIAMIQSTPTTANQKNQGIAIRKHTQENISSVGSDDNKGKIYYNINGEWVSRDTIIERDFDDMQLDIAALNQENDDSKIIVESLDNTDDNTGTKNIHKTIRLKLRGIELKTDSIRKSINICIDSLNKHKCSLDSTKKQFCIIVNDSIVKLNTPIHGGHNRFKGFGKNKSCFDSSMKYFNFNMDSLLNHCQINLDSMQKNFNFNFDFKFDSLMNKLELDSNMKALKQSLDALKNHKGFTFQNKQFEWNLDSVGNKMQKFEGKALRLNCIADKYIRINKLVPIKVAMGANPTPNEYNNNKDFAFILWFDPTQEFIDKLPKDIAERLGNEIKSLNNSTESCKQAPATGEPIFDVWRSCSGAIENLELFPNPATSKVTVKFNLNENRNASIALYDVSGRIIAELAPNRKLAKGTLEETFMLPNIPPGIYLISIKTDNAEQAVQRLVVE